MILSYVFFDFLSPTQVQHGSMGQGSVSDKPGGRLAPLGWIKCLLPQLRCHTTLDAVNEGVNSCQKRTSSAFFFWVISQQSQCFKFILCDWRHVHLFQRAAEQKWQLLTSQWPPVCLGPHVRLHATGVGSDSWVPCQAAAITTTWLDMMIFFFLWNDKKFLSCTVKKLKY